MWFREPKREGFLKTEEQCILHTARVIKHRMTNRALLNPDKKISEILVDEAGFICDQTATDIIKDVLPLEGE